MNQPLKLLFPRFVHYLSVILSILFIVLPTSAVAEDYGRYRAVVMHEEGRSGIGQSSTTFPKIFIMDSKEGHMWTWEQKKKIQGLKKGFTLGTVLTYQGRVKPGNKMGDIVEQSIRE